MEETKEEAVLLYLRNMAKEYIDKYLSPERAKEFVDACNNAWYDRTNEILMETIEKVCDSAIALSSINNVINQIVGCPHKTSQKRKRGNTMYISILIITILLICVCIAVGLIAGRHMQAQNNHKNIPPLQGQRRSLHAHNKQVKQQYTQEDKDMLKLIQNLAEVYQKTDDYLKR